MGRTKKQFGGQMFKIDEEHGSLPLLNQILFDNEQEEEKIIGGLAEQIFTQFANKDVLNLQHVLLTIQNDANLMKKYGAAYICLRQYMKAGVEEGGQGRKMETKKDFINLLKGHQIPGKALNFFSDSQFATFYEILDLQKEGSLDQDDFERAFQLIKNMKASHMEHGLQENQKPSLEPEEIGEIALFLETLDEYSKDDDNIISPEEYYAALTFEPPIQLRGAVMKSKLRGITKRPENQQ